MSAPLSSTSFITFASGRFAATPARTRDPPSPPADDDRRLLVRPLLGDHLLVRDDTVQTLVCGNGLGHRAKPPLPLIAFRERVIDPTTQRIGPPGPDRPVPRLDQLGVDRDGHAFLAGHTHHYTTLVILLYNRQLPIFWYEAVSLKVQSSVA